MAAQSSRDFEKIARDCVRKKDERGEQIVISLDGRKRDRPLQDEDFVAIAKFLPDVVQELAAATVRGNRTAQVEFHGECNECGDDGAAAICRALLQLRTMNTAAVRAVYLWKNELGDAGARSVAELLEQSSLPGNDRGAIAEVHLSHNKITLIGAEALFAAALKRYPRASHCGQVPLWLRLEHNAIDLEKLAPRMPPHCRAEHRGDRRGGVQRTVHASNCGVSQCCQPTVPSLHLHLIENQDKKKVEEARTLTPSSRSKAAPREIVLPPSRGWGNNKTAAAGAAPPPSSAQDFPSLPGGSTSGSQGQAAAPAHEGILPAPSAADARGHLQPAAGGEALMVPQAGGSLSPSVDAASAQQQWRLQDANQRLLHTDASGSSGVANGDRTADALEHTLEEAFTIPAGGAGMSPGLSARSQATGGEGTGGGLEAAGGFLSSLADAPTNLTSDFSNMTSMAGTGHFQQLPHSQFATPPQLYQQQPTPLFQQSHQSLMPSPGSMGNMGNMGMLLPGGMASSLGGGVNSRGLTPGSSTGMQAPMPQALQTPAFFTMGEPAPRHDMGHDMGATALNTLDASSSAGMHLPATAGTAVNNVGSPHVGNAASSGAPAHSAAPQYLPDARVQSSVVNATFGRDLVPVGR
jgi:hypothetical protein